MTKYDTAEEAQKVFATAVPLLEQLDIEVEEDNFTIVQPFNEGHAIVVRVSTDEYGERTVGYDVNDTTLVLPKKDGALDVFK